ncbi:MAG: HD domain-containing protein [Clostridia bacterium]|nr:HD domain-containing protein [Clostridia bacterium]
MTGSIIARLIAFDRGDRRRIGHAFKVTGYAAAIASGEKVSGGDKRILEAAAILHDIGILPALAKYGHARGEAQEELGPPEARRILASLDWSDEDIRRVEFLIGHHHSYDVEGGLLLQILIEADFLVNIDEGVYPDLSPVSLRDRHFRTPSGIAVFNALYPHSKT